MAANWISFSLTQTEFVPASPWPSPAEQPRPPPLHPRSAASPANPHGRHTARPGLVLRKGKGRDSGGRLKVSGAKTVGAQGEEQAEESSRTDGGSSGDRRRGRPCLDLGGKAGASGGGTKGLCFMWPGLREGGSRHTVRTPHLHSDDVTVMLRATH